MERLTNDRADVLAVLHEEVVLRAGPGDPDVVRLLERVVADARRRHLPRERDDGNRVHHRVLQRGHEVGRGRPRGHQTDTDLPRRARVAFGRMAGGGLLADEDVTQTFEVVENVVDRKDGAARQAEDRIHALALETFEHHPRP